MKFSDLILPKPRFATHNLSKTFRGSMNPGLLYPIYHRYMLPGDKFKINLRHLIRTEPTITPVMGRFKVRIVTVVSNLKNYAIALEGYRRSFDWRTVTLPYYRFLFPTTIVPNDGSTGIASARYSAGIGSVIGVRETSLADYLGFERGWFPTPQQYSTSSSANTYVGNNFGVYDDYSSYKSISFIPFLAYYDFYRNYMLNPQERSFPMVTSGEYADVSNVESLTESYITPVPVDSLDKLIEACHTYYDGESDSSEPVNDIISEVFPSFVWDCYPGLARYQKPNSFSVFHGGLLGTMYDPDINTQWMSVDNYNKLNQVTVKGNVAGSVATTSFQDIVKASSLWQFMVGEAYSGGTYSDHIYGQYGVSVKSDMNIPQIIHVYDGMIDFEDITSQSDTLQNAGTDNESGSPIGRQGGVGRGYGQSPKFTVVNKDNNLAIMMMFAWITPMVDYSTGLPADYNIIKMSDFYVPAFDNYSMQPRLQEQVLSSPVSLIDGEQVDIMSPEAYPYSGSTQGLGVMPADVSLGYQPAFTEYKTDYNTVHGTFKNADDAWVILRQYSPVGLTRISNGFISSYVYTPYSDESVKIDLCRTYNVPFVIPEVDNFKCQIRLDITAIRPISKSMIPNVK